MHIKVGALARSITQLRSSRTGLALDLVNLLAVMIGSFFMPAAQAADSAVFIDPLLRNTAEQVSPHVYIIKGFPNVGIIVGDKATLVVNTGLGARNGALVARTAQRLSTKGQRLYLTTTHVAPELAFGRAGFPINTILIRNLSQQEEGETDGTRIITEFVTASEPLQHFFGPHAPQVLALMKGATFDAADILFDRQANIDLGGVHAQLRHFGAAHTSGDAVIFIPEDGVLLPGDLVQVEMVPRMSCADCSPRNWLAVLDQLAMLRPRLILPDHGGFGDQYLIDRLHAFLTDLQTRAMALKAEGKTAADAGQIITLELAAKYAGWQMLNTIPDAVQRAFADSP